MIKTLTTLLAFYIRAVLGCRIYPLERQQRAQDVGPGITNITSGPNQFAGRTTLSSGSATVTVSTFQVGSDSLIFLNAQHFTAQNSGFGSGLCVRTIAPGVSFTMGWSDGLGKGFDATLMWEMRRSS